MLVYKWWGHCLSYWLSLVLSSAMVAFFVVSIFFMFWYWEVELNLSSIAPERERGEGVWLIGTTHVQIIILTLQRHFKTRREGKVMEVRAQHKDTKLLMEDIVQASICIVHVRYELVWMHVKLFLTFFVSSSWACTLRTCWDMVASSSELSTVSLLTSCLSASTSSKWWGRGWGWLARLDLSVSFSLCQGTRYLSVCARREGTWYHPDKSYEVVSPHHCFHLSQSRVFLSSSKRVISYSKYWQAHWTK